MFLVAKAPAFREIEGMANQLKFILLGISLISGFLTACQTFKKAEEPTVSPSSVKAGQWEAKAMIKSLETGEASVVSLDVLGQKPNPMRVEVTTSMGISLASILVKENEIEYLLPKQKKYYHGPLSESSLSPVLKIKIDPRILTAAFFEESFNGWDCRADNGVMVACSTPEGVQVKWNREDPASKRVSITSPTFDVQVQIKKFVEKTELPPAALVLKVPTSYKTYKLK